MSRIDKIKKLDTCLLGSRFTKYSPEAVEQIACSSQRCTSCPTSARYFMHLVDELESTDVKD